MQSQIVKYGKQFLVIGNVNAITYKEIFVLIHPYLATAYRLTCRHRLTPGLRLSRHRFQHMNTICICSLK